MNAETIKGFSDSTGEEAIKRERIRKILVESFELFGFEPAETPVIEYEEFVRGENSQDEAVSDIFKLQDKGKRKLALRYEFTFQLKRIAKNKKLPYKRYQIGPVFRDEPVSSNRFRQFTQCDVDIIGSSIKEDAEILALASKVFNELGIKVEINVNNRKLLNELLEEKGVKEKNRESFIREVDKIDKLSPGEIKRNLEEAGAGGFYRVLKKPEKFFEKYKSYEEIKKLKKYCKFYGVKINFVPYLARGLSYYNGSVFEIKTAGVKETICAGGSYLVNGVQSTGISFGLERLLKLVKINLEQKSALIISIGKDSDSIKISEKLRKEKIKTSIWMKSGVTKALDYANSYKVPFVIFVGEQEVKDKKFKLKNMKTGKEELVSEKDLAKKILK